MTEQVEQTEKQELPGEGAADFLKIIGWLYCLASMFAGLHLMSQKTGPSVYLAESDPVLVAYGIGLMVSGVVFLALCQVIASICYNVRTIAQNSFNR